MVAAHLAGTTVVACHLPCFRPAAKEALTGLPTQHEVTRTGIANGTDMYLDLNELAPALVRPAAI
jgi:hypothetical protein